MHSEFEISCIDFAELDEPSEVLFSRNQSF